MMEQDTSTYALLRSLTPYDVAPFTKRRIGNPYGDGGYILLDKLDPSQVVYSFGIAQNPSFDRDMAERGHKVFMFDHTVDSLAVSHPNFNFFREGVAGTDKPDQSLFSLPHYLQRFGHENRNMILKMDVEGAEWEALAALPFENLMQFEQLTFEFHYLQAIETRQRRSKFTNVLEKLAKDFTLFHVHANNNQDVVCRSGFLVCPVIEASYVRSDLVTRRASTTLYPTALDTACNTSKRDILMTFFPYAPAISDQARMFGLIEDAATRVELQFQLEAARHETREAQAKLRKAEETHDRGPTMDARRVPPDDHALMGGSPEPGPTRSPSPA